MSDHDKDALGRWMAEAEPRVRRSLSSFATSVDTEAVVQETMLRIWKKGIWDIGLAKTIALHIAIDEQRRWRVGHAGGGSGGGRGGDDPPPPDGVGPDDSANAASDPALRAHISDCAEQLCKLRPKPCAAFLARVESGGTEPDAVLAVRVRMSHNTFQQNLTRARKFLAECLQKAGVDLSLFGIEVAR